MSSKKSLQATLLNTSDGDTDQNKINQCKPKIRTQYTNNETDYEKNSGISETVPDDTLSIPQILERFVKGQPVYASNRTPYYDSENDFAEVPDLAKMDLTEQADYFEAHRNNLAKLRKQFSHEEEQKRMDTLKAKLREELKAELLQTDAQSNNPK